MDVQLPTTDTRSPLRRLWAYTGGHRRQVVAAIAVTVLNKLADVMPELLIGAAVDVVVRRKESFVGELLGIESLTGQLTALAVVNVGVWLVESGADFVAHLLWRNLAQTVQHQARMDVYAHVQDLELAWFEDQSTGGLLSILNDDVNQLERFLDIGAIDMLATAVNVVFVGAVFFVVAPELGLVAFLPIPVIIYGSILFQRRLEPRYTRVRQAAGDVGGLIAGNLAGIATIRAFTAERREVARVETASRGYRDANGDAIRLSSAFTPIIRLAILAAFTATLIVGGRAALRGDLNIGIFSVLVYMTQRLLWPLTRLGETFDLYQRAMASTRRILDLLAVHPTITSGAGALPSGGAGDVRFEAVDFSYGPGTAPVLNGFDLHVPAGETHAIVGSTGAGKSTVVKLLLRLYEPTAGAVRIDGVDVRDVTFASLRGAMGYVGQDVFLFQGTVRENVAYGRPDATDEEVVEACRRAEADAFVRELPHGYDTVVGERGQKLSGGQRQRLSIARAIVREPRILVLDEATSAVDNETEAAIQRSLEAVGRDRTVVVIAHRLSTVRHADRIHVLERGRVVESGTHDELVATGGLYAALWRVQTGEADALPALD
ncbi:ABC transporter ATP-binding protein [Iamia sp. SCSIO 61187]|uniref:ABC transporter ATP-binding protein n=1 Tax=Iamia sp. SCSIO 61187 TaxID=2722752 RepID=UPI002103C62E|nr:ABC transporter ATP-binding protein [Iamia sp. SCSIO 61187]QYG95264.1 ABC transporter ATP-binding protein [Iamia sp. SCSIO 61187]